MADFAAYAAGGIRVYAHNDIAQLMAKVPGILRSTKRLWLRHLNAEHFAHMSLEITYDGTHFDLGQWEGGEAGWVNVVYWAVEGWNSDVDAGRPPSMTPLSAGEVRSRNLKRKYRYDGAQVVQTTLFGEPVVLDAPEYVRDWLAKE